MEQTDYLKLRAFNAGGAKLILQSPRHFWAERIDPNRKPIVPTPAMQFGSAVHLAVLEPGRLAGEIVIVPDDAPDRRSKAGKEWWANFDKTGAGRIVMSIDDYLRMRLTAAAVHDSPVAMSLLADSVTEHTIVWVDRETRIECKSRLDSLRHDRRLIVDLKTAADASPDSFSRSIHGFGMHIQAAVYCDAVLAESSGLIDPQYVWIVAETKPPHNVAIYRASDKMIQRGRDLFRRAIRIYAECLENDDWPGYPDIVQEIDLPPWGYRDRPDAGTY
jgi:hypothetical protein